MMDLVPMCLSEKSQLLSGSELEKFILVWLFPPLCLLGLIGNILTLMVLLSSDITSRANTLLACLAFCDMVFLLFMVPHSMANFELFAFNYYFRWYYFITKVHLIGFANWSSAVAIWLVVAVCGERLLGIRYPFRTRDNWSKYCIGGIVFLIVVLAGILTSYNHISHKCVIKQFCNNTQLMSRCFDVTQDNWARNRTNDTPQFIKSYVKWSVIANAIFVVFIPIFLLAAFNMALMASVRQQRHRLINSRHLSTHSNSGNFKHAVEKGPSIWGLLPRRGTDAVVRSKTEIRIAVTVCSIVTCFTITQGPSAIVMSIKSLSAQGTVNRNGSALLDWYEIQTITSFLVIVGKTLNFILFCLSSSSFRQRLLNVLRGKLKDYQRRYSTTMNSTAIIRGQQRVDLFVKQIAFSHDLLTAKIVNNPLRRNTIAA
ncbi:hypothetical protein AB6A40_004249 [Gnathostoma spinigerum]|uniref:G-protein coupled receptors family 1 profile domain-containing protein n=1 Tax=Gnathostoma spinigerum TaxID=75299 RepID=A0ABD6EBY1_9BILA